METTDGGPRSGSRSARFAEWAKWAGTRIKIGLSLGMLQRVHQVFQRRRPAGHIRGLSCHGRGGEWLSLRVSARSNSRRVAEDGTGFPWRFRCRFRPVRGDRR